MFVMSQRLTKVEGFEKDITDLYEKNKVHEKYVLDSIDKSKREHESFKTQINGVTDKNGQKIQKFSQDQWLIQDRMEKCEDVQREQSKYKALMDEQWIKLKAEIYPLNENKLDIVKFNEFANKQNSEH